MVVQAVWVESARGIALAKSYITITVGKADGHYAIGIFIPQLINRIDQYEAVEGNDRLGRILLGAQTSRSHHHRHQRG